MPELQYPDMLRTLLENDGAGPGLGLGMFGEFAWLACAPEEVRPGFIILNGDRYPGDSFNGQALLRLSPAFRAAWGIEVDDDDGTINSPDMFDENGDGYFPRAVDGVSRAVGSKQPDVIINITGFLQSGLGRNKSLTNNEQGALYFGEVRAENSTFTTITNTGFNVSWFGFDASKDTNVLIADENRPKNVGLLPCIFLGIPRSES